MLKGKELQTPEELVLPSVPTKIASFWVQSGTQRLADMSLSWHRTVFFSTQWVEKKTVTADVQSIGPPQFRIHCQVPEQDQQSETLLFGPKSMEYGSSLLPQLDQRRGPCNRLALPSRAALQYLLMRHNHQPLIHIAPAEGRSPSLTIF